MSKKKSVIRASKSISKPSSIRPTRKMADALAARAKLSQVLLITCAAVNNGADRKNPPKAFQISLNNNATHQSVSKDGKKIGEQVEVVLTLTIEARDTPDDSDPKLSMMVSYRLIYSFLPGKAVSESQLAAFGAYCSAPIIWPYASEFVHSTSLRMGLPSLRLPMYEQGMISIRQT